MQHLEAFSIFKKKIPVDKLMEGEYRLDIYFHEDKNWRLPDDNKKIRQMAPYDEDLFFDNLDEHMIFNRAFVLFTKAISPSLFGLSKGEKNELKCYSVGDDLTKFFKSSKKSPSFLLEKIMSVSNSEIQVLFDGNKSYLASFSRIKKKDLRKVYLLLKNFSN